MIKSGRLWLTLFTLAALSLLIALGTWQLQRLAWKRDLIDRSEAALRAEPRPLGAVLSEGRFDSVRVRAVCPGLRTARFVELYAVVEGVAGSRLISACPVTDGPFGSVLVDRGFVADTVSWRPMEAPSSETVVVEGVLQRPATGSFAAAADDPANRRFFTRRVDTIAEALAAPRPAPAFLMAATPTADSSALRPMPTPMNLPNRHLENALTWYGLAAALVGVYAAVIIQDRRRARSAATA